MGFPRALDGKKLRQSNVAGAQLHMLVTDQNEDNGKIHSHDCDTFGMGLLKNLRCNSCSLDFVESIIVELALETGEPRYARGEPAGEKRAVWKEGLPYICAKTQN